MTGSRAMASPGVAAASRLHIASSSATAQMQYLAIPAVEAIDRQHQKSGDVYPFSKRVQVCTCMHACVCAREIVWEEPVLNVLLGSLLSSTR